MGGLSLRIFACIVRTRKKREGWGTLSAHCVGNARKIKSPGDPAGVPSLTTLRISAAGSRSPPHHAKSARVGDPGFAAPAMRLKFIGFRLGLRLRARNSR